MSRFFNVMPSATMLNGVMLCVVTLVVVVPNMGKARSLIFTERYFVSADLLANIRPAPRHLA
jgi:hypothetical protein